MKKTGKFLKFLSYIMMIGILLISFTSADIITENYQGKVSYNTFMNWESAGLSDLDQSELTSKAKRERDLHYRSLANDSIISFGISLLVFGIGELIVIHGEVDPLTLSEQKNKQNTN